MSVLEDLRGIEQRVAARLKELRPLVEEYAELQRVAERLGVDVPRVGEGPGSAPKAPTSREARRRRPKTKRRANARRQPGGTQAIGAERRTKVLELIGAKPGISVPEISTELGVDPPPLYRVVRKLQADGEIKKDGKGLQLA